MNARNHRLLMSALALVLFPTAACGSGDKATPTESRPPSSISGAPTSAPESIATPAPSSAGTARTVTRTTKPGAPPSTAAKPLTTDVLTGERVSTNPLIAVKIDNTAAGLPHFGVSQADIVYVEQVEGGLTRLIALFRSRMPDEVGPVRSVRSTDSELLSMYGKPGLAFSGGAGGPLKLLAQTSIVNLSPDTSDSAYWRSDKASGTYNLHVNLAKLAADSKGISQPAAPGFVFAAADPRLAKLPSVGQISVTMLSGQTGFSFSDGRYVVSRKGTPYTDYDGSHTYADNVLVQNVRDERDGTFDSIGSPSYISHTVGTGTFTLYRDGRAISGTWKRTAPDEPTSYLTTGQRPVLFKPGKTWVVLAPQSASITRS